MAHKHSIYDTDMHFLIDPITRSIKNQSKKTIVVRGDHNSERFTFEIPKIVEGHDMSLCNLVQIHYLNGPFADIYKVEDLQIDPEDESVVIFSWKIDRKATRKDGGLHFAIHLKCVSEDETIDYELRTTPFKEMTVSETIDVAEVITEEYPDILAEWEKRLEALEQGGGSGGTANIDLSNYVTKDMLSKVNADDVIERLSGTVNIYKPITDGWVENASVSITTGEVKVSESLYKNNVVTPLIPVVQDTEYSFTGQNDSMVYCYKENGEYIGYSLLNTIIGIDEPSYHYGQTLPLTTYIRFVTNLNTDLETTIAEFNSTFMLCKGVGIPSEYVGFDEGGYLFKDNVYISDKRVTEIAEKAALMLDEALSEILGSGEVE